MPSIDLSKTAVGTIIIVLTLFFSKQKHRGFVVIPDCLETLSVGSIILVYGIILVISKGSRLRSYLNLYVALVYCQTPT